MAPFARACVALSLFTLPLTAQRFDQVPPKAHLPVTERGLQASELVDLDGDNVLELVIGSHSDFAKILRSDGQGEFTTIEALSTFRVRQIQAGDLDGDGDVDLILDGLPFQVLRQDPGGWTEVTQTAFAGLAAPFPGSSQGLVDVDADNDLDFVARIGLQLALYLNDGTGVFTDVTATQMPFEFVDGGSFAPGDLDNDGDVDLLVARTGTVTIYDNDGMGTFTSMPSLVVAPGFVADDVQVADIDNDGDLDGLLAGVVFGGVLALRNNGGTLSDDTVNILPVGTINRGAVFEDLDGDGDVDLVLNGDNRVLINDGSGSFTDQTATLLDSDRRASSIAVGDVDGDGDADLVETRNEAGLPAILYLNDGTGKFVTAVRRRAPNNNANPTAMASGDLNGDGHRDLVVVARNTTLGGPVIQVLLNDGTANFEDVTEAALPVAFEDVWAVAVADLTNDGVPDIVAADTDSMQLWANNGSGTFTDMSALLPAGLGDVGHIVAEDFDGDGRVDLLLGTGLPVGPQNYYLRQTATGTFVDESAARLPLTTARTNAFAIGDIDTSGTLDVVVADSSTQNAIWLNDGTGTFTVAVTGAPQIAGEQVWDLASGDVNGDGNVDLILVSSTNSLFLGLAGTTFFVPAAPLPALPVHSNRGFLSDLDGDSDPDFLTINGGGGAPPVSVFRNDGVTGFVDVTASAFATPDAFLYTDLVIADLDGDADHDLAFTTTTATKILLNASQPHLSSPLLARAGRDYRLRVVEDPTQPTTWLLGVGALPAPLPTPFGLFRLDPALTLAAVTTPNAALDLSIPAATTLTGIDIYWQAVYSTTNPRLTDLIVDRVY